MKKNKALNKLKVEMLKNRKTNGNIISGFKYGLRKDISKYQFLDYIRLGQLPGGEFVFNNLRPIKNCSIGSTSYIAFNNMSESLKHEIEWAMLILEFYKDEINLFLTYSKKFEDEILLGEYCLAESTLNDIEEKFGVSLWLYENRFVLTQLKEGLEENKRYSDYLQAELTDKTVSLIVEFYSFKAEKDMSYNLLMRRVNNYLDYTKSNSFAYEIIREYLPYKVLLNSPLVKSPTGIEMAYILSFESMMSFIDYYSTLIEIIQELCLNNEFDYYEDDELRRILYRLNSSYNDSRIIKLLALKNAHIDVDTVFAKCDSQVLSEIIDLYTVAEYEKCITLIESKFNDVICEFQVLETYCKALMMNESKSEMAIHNNSIIIEILNYMGAIVSCENKNKNVLDLINLTKSLKGLNIKNGIVFFIERSINQIRENHPSGLRQMLVSRAFTPRELHCFESDIRYEIIQKMKELDLYSHTLKLLDINSGTSNESDSIPFYRVEMYKARGVIEKNKDEAIHLYEAIREKYSNLESKFERYYYERSIKELFYLYMSERHFDLAMKLFVDSYLIDAGLSLRMVNYDLYNILISDDTNDYIRDKIEWPIFNYLCNKNDYEGLYTSLFEFMFENDIQDLDNLLEYHEMFEKSKFVFLLQNIFIYDVYKNDAYYEPNKKYSFRIKALEKIKQIDSTKEKECNDLIKEQIYNQGINTKIKNIDMMRVFVDVQGILQEKEEIFLEKFKRYQIMKSLKLDYSGSDIYAITDLIEEINASQEAKNKYGQLKDLIIDFSREFLFNPVYGLEKFLSTRIRHGILDNHLLKSFRNLNLLSSDNVEFYHGLNEYWYNRIIEQHGMNNEAISIMKIVGCEFRKFYEDIIDITSDVKEIIRVQSVNHPLGMLDFSIITNEDILLAVNTDVSDILDYESFYNYLENLLWTRTEACLSRIREHLNSNVSEKFSHAFDKFEDEINSLCGDPNYNFCIEIRNKITQCKSLMKADIEVVNNWLVSRRSNEFDDFNLGELFSSIIEVNEKVNYEYQKINVVKSGKSPYLKGENFILLWDLLNILFTNAIKHCGYDDLNELNIDIEYKVLNNTEKSKVFSELKDENSKYAENVIADLVSEESKLLEIVLSNSISEKLDVSQVEEKIASKLSHSENSETYREKVLDEGGSGLIKIKSILRNIAAKKMLLYNIYNSSVTFTLYFDISKIESEVVGIESIIN